MFTDLEWNPLHNTDKAIGHSLAPISMESCSFEAIKENSGLRHVCTPSRPGADGFRNVYCRLTCYNAVMDNPMKSGLETSSFSSVIKPSTDLFRSVNGPWIDTFQMPDDKSRYGSFMKLHEQSQQHIKEILDEPNSPAKKSQWLYSSYLDTESIEKAGLSAIRDGLDLIDGAQSKTDLTRALGTFSITGGCDMFEFEVYGEPSDPEHYALHVEQSGIGLPDEAYYREDRYEDTRKAYTAFTARLLRLAGYAHAGEAEDQARRFVDLESRIASYHWDNVSTRDTQKTNNPFDYAKLSAMLPNFGFPVWLDSCQATYDATDTSKTWPLDFRSVFNHVNVHEPSFLKGVDALWKESDIDDLRLWMRVSYLRGWSASLNKDFEDARFDFYGKVLSGSKVQVERWKRGVSLVDGVCGEEVGREYVKRHFPENSKKRMERLVGNLIEAYHVSIKNSSWLGEETKRKALDKLSKFTPMIGYPEHWRDYSPLDIREDNSLVENMHAASTYLCGYMMSKVGKVVDRFEWEMNPQTVNAYYESSLNVIVFPAAILQPPFFQPDADDATNYGAIGSVIGHEIGHGFDDQGSNYDGDGKLTNWWTDDDRANFKMLTDKLIEQYNHYVPKDLQDRYADEPNKAPHVNGALTIGENIGDLSGVNIALKAYAFALDRSAGKPIDGSPEAVEASLSTAPIIDGYTGLQRFFLSYASIWREVTRPELAEQFLQIDPHSPAEFRTNGIVSNVDLFYKAFDVTPESPMWMNPDQRVNIW